MRKKHGGVGGRWHFPYTRHNLDKDVIYPLCSQWATVSLKRNTEDLASSLGADFYSQDIWLQLTTYFIYRLQNSLQVMGIRCYKYFSCSNQTWPFKYIKLYTRKLPTRFLKNFNKFNPQIFLSTYDGWNTILGTEDIVMNKIDLKVLPSWSFYSAGVCGGGKGVEWQ